MYLQEGKMQFLKDIQSLRDVTGEARLEKAIARIMKNEGLQTRNDREGNTVKPSKKETL